jgi:hypothetical protein
MCEVQPLVRSIVTHHTDSPSHPVKMRERDRGALPVALWHNRVCISYTPVKKRRSR